MPDISRRSDESVVVLDDFFDNAETDTRSRKLFFIAKTLKQPEDLFAVLVVETDAIVGKDDLRIIAGGFG